MAINTKPIFSGSGLIGGFGHADGNGGAAGPLKTANTAKDGTGTVFTVVTADATYGSYIRELRARPAGTNVATVLRIFINNASTNATLGNNILIGEMTLASTTLSEVAALQDYTFPINFILPAGFKINVTLGTTVAAGYFVSAIAGNYTLVP